MALLFTHRYRDEMKERERLLTTYTYTTIAKQEKLKASRKTKKKAHLLNTFKPLQLVK